ncbi:MAG: DUF7447 family protein [Acidiferrobacteraceae bacterium]
MYKTMAQIRARNRAAGFHFFDRDTMAFFKCKVYPYLYGGHSFVTRETDPSGHTGYTLRYADDAGKIHKLGAFMAYRTLESARAMAKRSGYGL